MFGCLSEMRIRILPQLAGLEKHLRPPEALPCLIGISHPENNTWVGAWLGDTVLRIISLLSTLKESTAESGAGLGNFDAQNEYKPIGHQIWVPQGGRGERFEQDKKDLVWSPAEGSVYRM